MFCSVGWVGIHAFLSCRLNEYRPSAVGKFPPDMDFPKIPSSLKSEYLCP